MSAPSSEMRGYSAYAVPPWLGVVALLTGYGISLGRSLAVGRAGAEGTFDDVSYNLAGLSLATILRTSGLPAFVFDTLYNPPHAPFSTWVAALAGLLGNPSNPRTYALNGLVITMLVFLVFRSVAKLSQPAAALFAGVWMASPLGFFSLDQFRPEPAFALVATLFAVSLARSISSASSAVGAGLWAAFLLYIKPTYYFVTFGLVFAGVVFLLAMPNADHSLRHARLRGPARLLVSFGISAIPFALVWLVPTTWYVLNNTRGELAEVWTEPTVQAALHKAWNLALLNLNWPAWILVGLLPLALAINVRRRNVACVRQMAVMVGVGLLIMFPVAVGRVGSYFAGVTSLTPILFATVTGLVGVVSTPLFVSRWRDNLGSLSRNQSIGVNPQVQGVLFTILVFVTLFTVGTLRPVNALTPPGLFPPLEVNARVLKTITSDCAIRYECSQKFLASGILPPILSTGIAEISDKSLLWEARLNGWTGEISGSEITLDAEAVLAGIGEFHYVVVPGEQADYIDYRLPISTEQDEIAEFLQQSELWSQVPVPVIQDRYLVFRRLS